LFFSSLYQFKPVLTHLWQKQVFAGRSPTLNRPYVEEIGEKWPVIQELNVTEAASVVVELLQHRT